MDRRMNERSFSFSTGNGVSCQGKNTAGGVPRSIHGGNPLKAGKRIERPGIVFSFSTGEGINSVRLDCRTPGSFTLTC
jgi:hypothetical protein